MPILNFALINSKSEIKMSPSIRRVRRGGKYETWKSFSATVTKPVTLKTLVKSVGNEVRFVQRQAAT